MQIIKFFSLFLITFFFLSCAKDVKNDPIIKEKNLEQQVIETYNEGVESLESGDALYAVKKFNEAEILYPQSNLAPKTALMAAYAYYSQDYYEDAIAELIRFVRVYPKNNNIDYAYYMLGICFYERIVDEKKDSESILSAQKYFKIVSKNFPNSEYTIDSNFKLDLIKDLLASKEMYIGRYYFDKKKWIPAINRFKTVINDYDTTIYTEEALHRLVEVHYILGLLDESEKYAKLLGYNYQSSKWYKRSYSVFDQNYKIKKEKSKKKISLLKKFKKLLNSDE